ncbi:DUF2501 domain-containing protein [uncultured Pluralibacter sp.]|uniref:DUF2501 domain-containing protein n=1 Tax=uncultured Pluralibacter sp. TaxID=1490864 RepID=UPI0026138B5C|nr:DUF2501 domain-containing protein [uncultured Pluralibacter sp.]
MKPAKRLLCAAVASCALLSTGAMASSLTDTLSSAANQLGSQSTTQQGGTSLSSLTSLLTGSGKALSADNMNNAAGILQYCAKQKLTNATDAQNVKDKVLDKLGLGSTEKQQQDTDYTNGIQGLLNAQNGQQLNLSTLGNTELGKKVKAKACDLVLKQGAKFIS